MRWGEGKQISIRRRHSRSQSIRCGRRGKLSARRRIESGNSGGAAPSRYGKQQRRAGGGNRSRRAGNGRLGRCVQDGEPRSSANEQAIVPPPVSCGISCELRLGECRARCEQQGRRGERANLECRSHFLPPCPLRSMTHYEPERFGVPLSTETECLRYRKVPPLYFRPL